MSQCTWFENGQRCQREATHPQRGRAGNVWADLCTEHHGEIEKALNEMDVKKVLASWIKACGGPKEMARSM